MIKKYKNGNTFVSINEEDGTKIRFTPDDEFMPDFAESCDVHISDRCDNGCEFCYAGCNSVGQFGKFNYAFLDNLHPHTEMAINLQSPVPLGLFAFLNKLKKQHIIVNVTVNQEHLMRNHFFNMIKRMQDNELIYGIGISLTDITDKFINRINNLKNVVIHVINGIVTLDELKKLSDIGAKVLILGYKDVGRGIDYHDEEVDNKMNLLYESVDDVMSWFNVISFDNLAFKQLDLKRHLTEYEWNMFYQGEDGSSTFFINLVDGTFGLNSLTTKEQRIPIENKSIDEMFMEVKQCNLIS